MRSLCGQGWPSCAFEDDLETVREGVKTMFSFIYFDVEREHRKHITI